MVRRFFAFSILAALLSMIDATVVPAQTTPSAAKVDTLANIQKLVTKTIGAQPKTVEATMSGDFLIITRPNSNMNTTTHEGRNNEAKIIASILAKSMARNPKSITVSTIRVEYISRKPTDLLGKVVDTVEFRKGPDGVFDFHQT